MYTKYLVPALCAAAFLDTAGASPSGHRHLHKKDIKYIATEVEIVTDIVYVTVTEGVPAAPAPATATPVAPAPESMYKGSKPAYPVRPVSDAPVVEAAPTTTTTPAPPPPPPATPTPAPAPSSAPAPARPVEEPPAPKPTTMVTATKPAPSPANPIESIATEAGAVVSSVVSEIAQPSAAPSSTPAKGGSSNTGRRGLAYNDASLVKTVLGMSNKFSWVYNWGSTNGGLDAPITFYPTLWGPQDQHTQGWAKHAQDAIDAGADALMSFNECDNSGQCNTAADVAAAKHKELMGPFAGKARILAPAITSSQEPGQGIQWLEAFEKACGSDCPYDAVNAHWYGPGGEAGADEFLGHIVKVHEAANGRPVWVTEFAATDGDMAAFMKHALDELDNNPKYNFVEKYAYFYLATGSLMETTTSLSSIGNIYITQ